MDSADLARPPQVYAEIPSAGAHARPDARASALPRVFPFRRDHSAPNSYPGVDIGDDYFAIGGERFRRRKPPQVLAEATFLRQLDTKRGHVIDLHEGAQRYTEDRVPTEHECFAHITKTTGEYLRDGAKAMERSPYLLIEGPTGCGKTTLAKTLCRLANKNAVELTFSGDSKQRDFMYFNVVRDVVDLETGKRSKSVVPVPGPLLDCMINGWTAIINEPNMMSADLQSLFFQIMDTGQIMFSDFEQLKSFYGDRIPQGVGSLPMLQAKEGFGIIASFNKNYIGTEEMNKAWIRRFKRHGGYMEMDYLPPEEETEAVAAELEQRNAKYERQVQVDPNMIKWFVTAADRLRHGKETRSVGTPPQDTLVQNDMMARKFRDLVSTRTVINWLENYLLNDLSAEKAAEKTFMVTLDSRNRSDAELKRIALNLIHNQVDDLITGPKNMTLPKEKRPKKPPVKPEITVNFKGKKVAGISEVAINGKPIEPPLLKKEAAPSRPNEVLIQEANETMLRITRDLILDQGRKRVLEGRIDRDDFDRAQALLKELEEKGLNHADSENIKNQLRASLKVTEDEYDIFLLWAESRYERLLRKKSLLKDQLPIVEVDVPSPKNIIPAVAPSTLEEIQILDAAMARGNFVKMRGHSGIAKSSVARTWAYLRDRRVLEYPFTGETKKGDFGEKTTMIQGETKMVVQFLYKCAEEGVVALINEFNMAWPEVATAFMSLADKGGKVTLSDGRVIHRHPGFGVIATENFTDPAFAQSKEYAGTKPQNQAVENRFGVNMVVDFPPKEEEAGLITFMNPDISDNFALKLAEFTGDMRAAMDSPTYSAQVKQALKNFAMSTDELMQMALRCRTDNDIALELANMVVKLDSVGQTLAAPHLTKLPKV